MNATGGRYVDVAKPLSVSQVSKRLRALENLWTLLDGRHAYNPVREVAEPKEPESAARGLPYDVVEAILAKMEDRGRAAKDQERKETRALTRIRLRVIAYTGLAHGELMTIRERSASRRATPVGLDQGPNQGGRHTRHGATVDR